MSKSFKITSIVFVLLLYYVCVPTIAFVYFGRPDAALRDSVIAPVISWSVFLFPVLLAGIVGALRKGKKQGK